MKIATCPRLSVFAVATAFLLLFVPQALAQQDDVTFVHGINSDPSAWAGGENYLSSFLDFDDHYVDYETGDHLSTLASDNYQEYALNSVVVAHSMGGLVSREVVHQGYEDRVESLITIGTPHTGAPIVESAGDIYTLLGFWFYDVANPWGILFGSNVAETIANGLLHPIANEVAPLLLNELFVGSNSAQDMAPGSHFLTLLNAAELLNHGSTLPLGETYFVYGNEDFHTQWRIAESAAGSAVEDGDLADAADATAALYFLDAAFTALEAAYYYWRYQDTGDMYYYFQYLRFQNASVAFVWGGFSLGYLQQAEYSNHIVGSNPAEDDAIVPIWSQAAGLVPQDRLVEAPGVNHLEEQDKDTALNKIRDAMIELGIPEQ